MGTTEQTPTTGTEVSNAVPAVPTQGTVYYPPYAPPRRSNAPVIAAALGIIAVLLVAGIYSDLDAESLIGRFSESLGGPYTQTYDWTYENTSFTLTVVINATTYNAYHSLSRTTDYASYVTDDAVVEEVASELASDAEAQGYDAYHTAELILAFVQCLPYTSDLNTTGQEEYPRYPVETLADGGGDCEDKAALFVSLVQSSAVDMDAVLLEYTDRSGDGHMAAGLWGSGLNGTFYTYAGRSYYYCETTSSGWLIGELPAEMRGYMVEILPC